MNEHIEIDLEINDEQMDIDLEVDVPPYSWENNMMKKERGNLTRLNGELLKGVTEIPDYFCSTNNTIEHVYLPEVEHVGNMAFASDAKLKTVVLPNATLTHRRVMAIDENGKYPYSGNMYNTTFEDNSSATFKYLPSLLYVSMPSLIKIPNQSELSECQALRYLDLPNLKQAARYSFDKIDIRFAVFPKLKGTCESLFRYCPNLTHIILPEIQYLGSDALSNNKSLEVVYLPKVISGSSSMYLCAQCESLRDVVIGNKDMTQVPLIGWSNYATSQPFSKADLSVLSIYVPDHMVDRFKTATNWSKFADNIKPQSEMPDSLWDEINNTEMEKAPQELIEEATA